MSVCTKCDECDECRAVGDYPAPPGWIHLALEPAPGEDDGSLVSVLGGHARGPLETATFCSWPCVVNYATVRAAVPADPQGSTP